MFLLFRFTATYVNHADMSRQQNHQDIGTGELLFRLGNFFHIKIDFVQRLEAQSLSVLCPVCYRSQNSASCDSFLVQWDTFCLTIRCYTEKDAAPNCFFQDYKSVAFSSI